MTIRDTKLKEVLALLSKNGDDFNLTALDLNVSVPTVTRYIAEAKARGMVKGTKKEKYELLEANVSLAMGKQKQMDTNRIERKSFRNHARISNAIEEYGKSLEEQLAKHGSTLSRKLPKYKTRKIPFGDEVGVLQITDTHFNELIDMEHNKYDFRIASARLKKFVNEARSIFKARKVSKVLVALTGDLLNSDRRLDEILAQSTNRAKASILAADLLKYVLLDLAQDFMVDVVSVMGNESRLEKEMTYGDNILSNNFDFTICAILDRILVDNKRIKFLSYDTVEKIVEIGVKGLWKKNLLVTHDFAGQSNKQKDTQATIGRYSLQLGVNIDYVIGGHIHATHNGDFVSRSASLPGANAYSDKKLNLAGRAGQNIYVFGKRTRLTIGIDLQETSEKGYPIEKNLEAYNAKSVDKTKEEKTIHKVVTTI